MLTTKQRDIVEQLTDALRKDGRFSHIKIKEDSRIHRFRGREYRHCRAMISCQHEGHPNDEIAKIWNEKLRKRQENPARVWSVNYLAEGTYYGSNGWVHGSKTHPGGFDIHFKEDYIFISRETF